MNKREMRYYLFTEDTEGIHYLVNGWRKYKAFWTPSFSISRNTFKSGRSAWASYNRLYKSMPEYNAEVVAVGSFLWEV